MQRHQHHTNNDVLGAPPGTPIEECNALPITRVIWADTGNHGVISYWMPSDDERKLIAAGQPVRLMVLGVTHPPLLLGVDGDGAM